MFVEFNAWLYQGYDDARAALMEVIARQLIERGEETQTGLEKAKMLLGRVNWLRLAGLTAGSALSVAAGVPPLGLIGAVLSAGKSLVEGNFGREDMEAVQRAGKALVPDTETLVTPVSETSPHTKAYFLFI